MEARRIMCDVAHTKTAPGACDPRAVSTRSVCRHKTDGALHNRAINDITATHSRIYTIALAVARVGRGVSLCGAGLLAYALALT